MKDKQEKTQAEAGRQSEASKMFRTGPEMKFSEEQIKKIKESIAEHIRKMETDEEYRKKAEESDKIWAKFFTSEIE